MSTPLPSPPIHYHETMEKLEDGEAETIGELVETMRGIAETTYRDGGHAIRSVHAKSHGLLRGELRVLDGLPDELAQGLFAKAGTYPVVFRLSTSPGDLLDDSVSTPRGLAMKVIGVEGLRVSGSEGDTTQDFVMVNSPAFLAPTAKAFAKNAKLLAATTDKAQGLKKALSAVLRGTEKVIEAVGGESGTIKSLGGHPETHILGETFFTQVPLLYGPYMAKVSLAPVSPELKALTDAALNVNGKPNGLREAVSEFFARHGGEWELRVQLNTDIGEMPIEDASVEWPQEKSAYRAVARLRVEPQESWPESTVHEVEDRLSFSPWHALSAHRPLGSIMRVRKAVYAASVQFRTTHNGVTAAEPRSVETSSGSGL